MDSTSGARRRGLAHRVRYAVRVLLGDVRPESSDHEAERSRQEKQAIRERRRVRDEEKRQLRLARLIRAERREHAKRQAVALWTGESTTVPLDYPAHEIQLLVSSEMERAWRANFCQKEPWSVAWIESSLRDGGVLYDIGANVGAFSLVAAKVAAGRGRIVAFEPGYASFARLCDNIVLNRCDDAIIPVPLAVGSTTSLGTFSYRSLHAGQSRHEFKEGGWSTEDSGEVRRYHQPVLSMTLDDLVRQFALPRPTHIKIDVDGGELNVLRGAASTLADAGLQSILIEVDLALSDDVTAALAGFGFQLADRYDQAHRAQTQVWYGVFRRP